MNASGQGAFTTVAPPAANDGISIVQVGGASTVDAFQLAGGYVTDHAPFRYNLFAYGPGSPNLGSRSLGTYSGPIS